jgi:hypothetical protein
MRRFLAGKPATLRQMMPTKLEAIRRLRGQSPVYAETNHCFIKGFGWLIPEHIPTDRIAVVILKRDKSEIVRSLQRIRCTPLTDFGRQWLITPEATNRLTPFPDEISSPRFKQRLYYSLRKTIVRRKLIKLCTLGRTSYPDFITGYEKALLNWYVDETWAMADCFRERFKGIAYFEYSLNQLNTLSGVQDLFRRLSLEAEPECLSKVVGIATNRKLRVP